MSDATAGWVEPRFGGSAFPNEPTPDAAWSNYPRSLATLARLVGSCVYFIRTDDDLIKIGFTSNLANRHRVYGPGWDHLLAVTPGTYEDEQALHREFRSHLARGREFYHPAPEILEYVNEIRERMGVPAV